MSSPSTTPPQAVVTPPPPPPTQPAPPPPTTGFARLHDLMECTIRAGNFEAIDDVIDNEVQEQVVEISKKDVDDRAKSKKRNLNEISRAQWTADELWSRRVDYKDYNQRQLREECKRFGMSVEGLKGKLVKRLKSKVRMLGGRKVAGKKRRKKK